MRWETLCIAVSAPAWPTLARSRSLARGALTSRTCPSWSRKFAFAMCALASVLVTFVEILPQDPIGSGGRAISSLQSDRELDAQRVPRTEIAEIDSAGHCCDMTHSHDQTKGA